LKYGTKAYIKISHTSKNIKTSMPEALENGKVEIIFNGRIIKGKYALVRFKQENNKSNWLLIKKNSIQSLKTGLI
jgi:hypothetical protein